MCSICCGTGREVTVSCPLDCEHLQDARRHEKLAPLDPGQIPNQDVRVTEDLLKNNEELLVALSGTLLKVALETPGVVDADMREALDGLTQTFRTLQSGVYYESVPANPLAARLFRAVQEALEEYRRTEPERHAVSRTRDSDVLALLVFLQRLERDRNNGRPRGRAFVDLLLGFYPPGPAGPAESSPSLLIS